MAALARLCCVRAHVVGVAQGKRGGMHPRPQRNRTKESRTHSSAAEDSPGMLGTSHERVRGFSVLGECRDSTRRMERGSISQIWNPGSPKLSPAAPETRSYLHLLM